MTPNGTSAAAGPAAPSAQAAPDRIEWIDYAKGISIILVVMMHPTLSSEEAWPRPSGWMHPPVEFARPFRIPAFFLIAGLFAIARNPQGLAQFLSTARSCTSPISMCCGSRSSSSSRPGLCRGDVAVEACVPCYLLAFIDPFGTLWFIYLLPVFYVVTG